MMMLEAATYFMLEPLLAASHISIDEVAKTSSKQCHHVPYLASPAQLVVYWS